jgi:GH18 family chitinase
MKKLFVIALLSASMMACGGGFDDPTKPTPKPPIPPEEEQPAPEPPELPGSPSGVPMKTVGYIPDYSYNSIKNNTLDWSALTHLNLAFVNPDEEGNMIDNFPPADLKMIVDRAHQNRVMVLPSIGGGGGGETVADLIATTEGIEALCDNIIDYLIANNMDGVDLDLEFGEGPIWKNYGEFVALLRTACDENDLLLTTAVSTWFSDNISDETLQSFDIVNMMAYDNNADGFAYHSSYEFAETMAAYYIDRGVEPGRIVIGVPFYGYPKDGNWGSAKSYADILKTYPDAWKSDFAGTFSYNGHQTLEWKCRLATVYGGIMIWQLDQDASGSDSLLKVIKDNL